MSHRPWPPPRAPWVLFQRWEYLLFMHWPVPVEALRPRVPPSLPIETFEGRAWLGIVPLHMRDVHPRLLPPIPGQSSFLELNVRTYVTLDDKPGVFFLSLDAANPLAVAAARIGAHLAYLNARMRAHHDRETVRFESHRTDHRAPAADFAVTFRPVGPGADAEPGSLADWLTARYCLYAADRHGRLTRVEVDHPPWQLHPAEATIDVNTVAAAHGIALPDQSPLLHYARRTDVRTWLPSGVEGIGPGPS